MQLLQKELDTRLNTGKRLLRMGLLKPKNVFAEVFKGRLDKHEWRLVLAQLSPHWEKRIDQVTKAPAHPVSYGSVITKENSSPQPRKCPNTRSCHLSFKAKVGSESDAHHLYANEFSHLFSPALTQSLLPPLTSHPSTSTSLGWARTKHSIFPQPSPRNLHTFYHTSPGA